MALLSGSRACSMRSFTFIVGASWVWTACPPKARNLAPSTELGVTTAAAKEKTTSTTVTNTTMVNIKGIVIPESLSLRLHKAPGSQSSYLKLYDLSDYEIANGLQSDAGHQQSMADG